MQELMNAIHWNAMQANLPIIACTLALVPILLLLYSDSARLSAKNDGKKSSNVKVLSHMCDKDGRPVFVDLFGRPIEQPIAIDELSDFEVKRQAGTRGAGLRKNR